ncbi:MAG: phosphoribosylformylglycinamidine synthase subunit PurQ [Desulforegulaceae bacterium]|nr:phosphoribosylformylglycinamidine synthase subunit PurQ [Desulforegulaceae bacterium]
MMKVKALVLTGFGINCDNETAHALELAGAVADKVHINDIISKNVLLKDYKIFALSGGSSWGDEHGAGVLQAIRMKTHFGEELQSFALEDNLVIGIGNGFQTLVNLGLLPGFDLNSMERKVALINNENGNFINDWVYLTKEFSSNCVFTKGLDNFELPIRHSQGKFYTDEETLKKIEKNNQVVLRYSTNEGKRAENKFPQNPDGSLNDIAGISDSTGRIFGLMPHPEGFVHWTHHPQWDFISKEMEKNNKDLFNSDLPKGLKIFKNAVDYFS